MTRDGEVTVGLRRGPDFYADSGRHLNEVRKFLGLPPRRLRSRVRYNYTPA